MNVPRPIRIPPEARPAATIAIATWFLVTLLLDRFSGWHVSSVHPLIAGSVLAFLVWREEPRKVGRFFLLLFVLIAWMLLRDVGTGGDWRAGERTLKASVLLLGLIACCHLSLPIWRASLRWATAVAIVCIVAYLRPDQIVSGLAAPMAMAVSGFASEMNRNALAVPLGLLACWIIVAVGVIRPGWLWGGLAAFTVMLMIANGSRNALLSMCVAVLLAVFLLSPRKVGAVCGALTAAGLLMFWVWPSFWIHGDSLLSYRDVIWETTFRHIASHAGMGAGSTYFSRVIAPELPIKFAFSHNVYLDFLLAYGIVGGLLLLAAGAALWTLLPKREIDARSIFLYASGGYLMMFGVFDREHLDPLMLAGMLSLPGIAMAVLASGKPIDIEQPTAGSQSHA